MGAAVTKNTSISNIFNQSITNTMNSVMMSVAHESVSTTNPTQLITINAKAAGDVNIKGVTQKVIANISAKKLISNVSSTELESMLESAVKTTVEDNQEIKSALVIGAAVGENVSELNQLTQNIQNISSSYSYSQFISDVNNILSQQTITLNANSISGNVNIEDISQFVQLEIISEHIAEILTEKFDKITNTSEVTVDKKSDQTNESGISNTALIFIAIAIIVIAIVGFVIYKKVRSGGGYNRDFNSGVDRYGGNNDDDWAEL